MARRFGRGEGILFVLLLGLPFLGVGIGMGVYVGKILLSAQKMKSWIEVPAIVASTELKVSRGDKSTTYRAVAQYSYSYRGRTYQGDRVSLHGGSDNVGSFHSRVHSELSRYQQSKEPFRCYVNPDNPFESILYREPRWEMIGFLLVFVLVFGGVGLGLTIVGVASFTEGWHSRTQKVIQPDKPWMWRLDWAQGIVKSSNRLTMGVVITLTVFWNAIALPIGGMVVREVIARKADPVALWVLIFPVVGLGLVAWSFRSIAKWRKFGESRFQMATCPGVVGGPLGGVIHVPVHIHPEDGFHLTLSCINRITTGTGKHRSTSENILWQDTRVMKHELLERDSTKSAIPVLFGIPFDSRPTDDTDSNNEVLWRLEVKAKVPGIDYSSRFDVPVYKTPASSPDFKLDESAVAPYQEEPDADSIIRNAGIRIEPLTGGGTRLHFSPARHLGSAWGLTGFFAIWVAFLILMLKTHAPLFFPILFGVVAVFVLFGVLRLWFASWTIETERNGLILVSRFLGWTREQKLNRSDIKDIGAIPGMRSGNTLFHDIKLSLQDGKILTAAGRLASQAEAQAVIRKIKDAWGESVTDAGFSGGQKLPPMAKSIPVK